MLILKELLITFNLARDNFNGYYFVDRERGFRLMLSNFWFLGGDNEKVNWVMDRVTVHAPGKF